MTLYILSLLSGILSGLAVGGGTLLVPGLVLLMGVDQHTAQGIALLVFIPTSVLAIVTHWRMGHVNFRVAGMLSIGSMVGAALGAYVALRMTPVMLRRVFGIYLVAMGAYQFFKSPPKERLKELGVGSQESGGKQADIGDAE
jgi:uncharacterized membrane protein YfcA